MRAISEIIAEGESLTAHIEDLETQLHDAKKRLDVLQAEADRAVRATFRAAGGKPKNTRVTGRQLAQHPSVNGAGEASDP